MRKNRKMLLVFSVMVIVVGISGFATSGLGQSDDSPDEVEKLNINEATVEELAELPGINKMIAEIIVNHRTEHGSFKSTSELRQFKHIREDHRWNRIKDLITVD